MSGFRKTWFRNRWKSDEGYSIEIVDRATIEYTDGREVVIIGVEKLAARRAWAIWPNQMWIKTVPRKLVTDDVLRGLILARVRALFDFLGWKLEVA